MVRLSHTISLCSNVQRLLCKYISALNPVFGELRLKRICFLHIQKYQKWRSKSAGASRINHEVNTLEQILRYAELSVPVYERIPLPRWTPQRVLSPKEERRLFQFAGSNPRWLVAYCVMRLSTNTTASGCEIRGLRIKHLDLVKRVLYIPSESGKNEFRMRVIPLNSKGLSAAVHVMHRYTEICGYQGIPPSPEHYLFPFRARKGLHDLDKKAGPTFIRAAFDEIRVASGVPWLRQHDLRYQAITKLLELPLVSEQTVKSIAGHVSEKMLNHYSHIRIHAKRKAVNALRAS